MSSPNEKPRRWFTDWRVWFCLALAGLGWLITFPLRLLDGLLSIFR